MKTTMYDDLKVNYEYEVINPESNFCITGYWWGRGNVNKNSKEGKTYEQLADRLIDSCIKNNCNYFIAEIPAFAKAGGYQIAINYKPAFILNTLEMIYPRTAAAIDTDMTIEKYPDLFDLKMDYMGYNWYYEPRVAGNSFPLDCFDPYILKTSGGIMVFGNTESAKEFLRSWENITDSMPGKAEDRTISIAFARNNFITKLRCLWLPLNYFYIPYFYEIDDVFEIPKKYQKFFPHLKFSGNETKQEYTFGKVFKITKNNLYILHPEGLTTEEQAALQGASSDRIPEEYYTEIGKKLKCLTRFGKMINIPKLYCDTRSQVKSMSSVSDLLDDLKYLKLETKIPSLSCKSKFKIVEENIKNQDDILFVFNDYPSKISFDYIVIEIPPHNKNKSFIIHKLMKKYNKSIIYLENCVSTKNNLEKLIESIGYADFACINGYESSSVYKKKFIGNEHCNDKRTLYALTTDILFFRNNKFGSNLLKLWNHCQGSKRIDDKYSLSIAFNKYMNILFMRVQWLYPGFFCPIKQNIFVPKAKVVELLKFETELKETKNIDLYSDFKQCKEKPPISNGDYPLSTHYK